jgi:hypothetical protein
MCLENDMMFVAFGECVEELIVQAISIIWTMINIG